MLPEVELDELELDEVLVEVELLVEVEVLEEVDELVEVELEVLDVIFPDVELVVETLPELVEVELPPVEVEVELPPVDVDVELPPVEVEVVEVIVIGGISPLVVVAGKEYGTGSSRDWAAKGTLLLGVRAVIVESYERIHRSNLIGMGVLPLQFRSGDSIESLQLDGTETFDVEGLQEAISSGFANGKKIKVVARRADGSHVDIPVVVRIDTPQEVLYYVHGGILQYVIRQLLLGREKAEVVSASMAATAQASPEHTPHDDQVHEGSVESFPASDAPAY